MADPVKVTRLGGIGLSLAAQINERFFSPTDLSPWRADRFAPARLRRPPF
jgi:hypothetical protein